MANVIKRFLDWSSGQTNVAYTGGGRQFQSLINQTKAGEIINETTCLTIPAILHGIRLYGQVLGSLDWDLIQHSEDGKKIARSHPIHRLLHDEPNEFMNASSFREVMIGNSFIYGTSYAYIEFNGNQRATGLIPLLPDRTYPVRKNGEFYYETEVNGAKQKLQPYETFNCMGFTLNGLTGVRLIQTMRETLGLTKAEETFAASYFGNGCNLGGTAEYGAGLSEEAKRNLREQTDNRSGLGNAFRILFFEEGTKFTQATINAEAAQLIASRTFQIDDLARALGLPPHMLYSLARSTNNNIEHQGIEAINLALKPVANRICQEANRKLLYESERGIFETVIDLKPLARGDEKTQAERDQIRFNCCAITPNEIRANDGRNPIAGGDQLFINVATQPLNMMIALSLQKLAASQQEIATAEAEGQDSNPPEQNPEPTPLDTKDIVDLGPKVNAEEVENVNTLPSRSILKPVIEDTIARLIRRETRAAEQAFSKGTLAQLLTNSTDAQQHVLNALQPIVRSLTALGRPLDLQTLADAFTAETKRDLELLAKSNDKSDCELMLHGWNTTRTQNFINEMLGE